MSFTPKQARFVEEYLIDLNATQAAIRAGYSKRTAEQQGYQLLQKTSVREAIAEAMQERSKRTEIDQDWIVERLVENVGRAMQVVDVTDREGNPAGKYTYQGAVANKALELLGRHLGMFTDNLNLGGSLNVTHEEALEKLK